MRRSLLQLTTLIFAGFGVIALGLLYWGLIKAPALAAREDNPRLVLAEQRIHRGRILDRAGQVLAESVPGPRGAFVRHYPYPQAAPVTGYYSLRYGTLAVEATYDTVLRGTLADSLQAQWNAWLHRPLQGRDVRLTIDLSLQRAADAALGDRHGAVVLLSLPDGAIRALASHPTYDPNRLDETFDDLRADPGAPLLNRATQGLYQPGAALETITLAAALEHSLISTSNPAPNAADALHLDTETLTCALPPGPAPDYLSAFVNACPTPFADFGPRLGPDTLVDIWSRFGLDREPDLPLPVITGVVGPLSNQSEQLRAAAAGQGSLLITPLQMALVAAAMAESGTQPQPHLVEAIQSDPADGGTWQPVAPQPPRLGVLAPATAYTLRAALRQAVTDGAAAPAALPRVEVAGHAGTALAGRGSRHTWFIGYAPSVQPRYAIVVLIEGSRDAGEAARVAGMVLGEALR